MQVDAGHVVFGVKLYRGVTRLPVEVVADGGVHQGFDLTHDALGLCELRSV